MSVSPRRCVVRCRPQQGAVSSEQARAARERREGAKSGAGGADAEPRPGRAVFASSLVSGQGSLFTLRHGLGHKPFSQYIGAARARVRSHGQITRIEKEKSSCASRMRPDARDAAPYGPSAAHAHVAAKRDGGLVAGPDAAELLLDNGEERVNTEGVVDHHARDAHHRRAAVVALRLRKRSRASSATQSESSNTHPRNALWNAMRCATWRQPAGRQPRRGRR